MYSPGVGPAVGWGGVDSQEVSWGLVTPQRGWILKGAAIIIISGSTGPSQLFKYLEIVRSPPDTKSLLSEKNTFTTKS